MSWRSHTPPVTLVLFLVTVTAYLFQVFAGGEVVARAIGLIPTHVSNLTALTAVGDRQEIPAWLTLITYMFLHKSWWHVTTNMAGLWFFGGLAEPLMGSRRFLFTYLASGVFTGIVIVFLVPHGTTPAVGASGAICGTRSLPGPSHAPLGCSGPSQPQGLGHRVGVHLRRSVMALTLVAAPDAGPHIGLDVAPHPVRRGLDWRTCWEIIRSRANALRPRGGCTGHSVLGFPRPAQATQKVPHLVRALDPVLRSGRPAGIDANRDRVVEGSKRIFVGHIVAYHDRQLSTLAELLADHATAFPLSQ